MAIFLNTNAQMTLSQKVFWLTVATGHFPAKVGKYVLTCTDGDRAIYSPKSKSSMSKPIVVELHHYLVCPKDLYWDPTEDELEIVKHLSDDRSPVRRYYPGKFFDWDRKSFPDAIFGPEEYRRAKGENPLLQVEEIRYDSPSEDWDCIGFKEKWGCD